VPVGKRGSRKEGFAPTIAFALGIDPPEDSEGEVLHEVFAGGRRFGGAG
jgi:hypothetical protein